MSKVYVVQNVPRMDFDAALEYGDIEILLPETIKLVVATHPIVSELRKKLRPFSKDDFLVPVGQKICVGLATAIAAGFSGGEVTFLRWYNHSKKYYKVHSGGLL